jgi:predicted deacylase
MIPLARLARLVAVLAPPLWLCTSAQTVYTGDTLQGYPVISALDVHDVPANAVSRFWLSPATGQGGGLPYFLPIFVARGSEASRDSGRKLSLSASIHGDELSPVAIVQRVFAGLRDVVAAGRFNGTVVGLPTQNPQGNLLNQRRFFTNSPNGVFTDLNREFPGESIEAGGNLGSAYTAAIWNDIWGNKSNVDIAVDFRTNHLLPVGVKIRLANQPIDTLQTGSNGPLWCYADYRFPGVQRIAELLQPDMIKIDPGDPGTIETTWIRAGVPAITVESGPANVWNRTLVQRSVDFAFRLMDDLRMTDGVIPQPDLSNTYIATNFSSPTVKHSGWAEMDISVMEDVQKGQVIGRVYNSWGDKLEDVKSLVTGKVLTVLSLPTVEAGGNVATIGYNATQPAS